MNMQQAILKKLQVTVVVASILTLYTQPSYSFDASPGRSLDNQAAAADNLRQAESHNNRGVELAQEGKLPEAIAAFNRAIEINPSYENAHNNLGLALGTQQHFFEAADAFKHALAINPNNFETYNNLGIALGLVDFLQIAIGFTPGCGG